MIYNLDPLLQQIRQTELRSVSAARAQAMGGLLRSLEGFVSGTDTLLCTLSDMAVARFRKAATSDEMSLWLSALLHMTDEDNLFADTMDEEEYDELMARKQRVQHRWQEEIGRLTNAREPAWADLPLAERLRRLQLFYRQDIHRLSRGEDQKAHALLKVARQCFEQCRTELFCGQGHDVETYRLYYEVLCLSHPNHHDPAHAHYYRQYFCAIDTHFAELPADSDQEWQLRAVAWHHRLQREHHYDPSLLPRLSFVDPTACAAFRRQCYVWMLNLDPDDDGSIQEAHDHERFIRQGIQCLMSWLDAKAENHVAIPAGQELEALLTLSCALKVWHFAPMLSHAVEQRAYQLLPRLANTRQKAHLMVHVALDTLDDTLLAEADTLLATWADTPLTPEDNFLLQLHRPAPVLNGTVSK